MDEFNPYLHWLGIRDPHRPPNHYRLLGLDPFEEDQEVITNAGDGVLARVRSYRPGDHLAQWQRLLDELMTAKRCLMDADAKQEYDRQLRRQLDQPQQSTAGPSTDPPTARSSPAGAAAWPPGMGPHDAGGSERAGQSHRSPPQQQAAVPGAMRPAAPTSSVSSSVAASAPPSGTRSTPPGTQTNFPAAPAPWPAPSGVVPAGGSQIAAVSPVQTAPDAGPGVSSSQTAMPHSGESWPPAQSGAPGHTPEQVASAPPGGPAPLYGSAWGEENAAAAYPPASPPTAGQAPVAPFHVQAVPAGQDPPMAIPAGPGVQQPYQPPSYDGSDAPAAMPAPVADPMAPVAAPVTTWSGNAPAAPPLAPSPPSGLAPPLSGTLSAVATDAQAGLTPPAALGSPAAAEGAAPSDRSTSSRYRSTVRKKSSAMSIGLATLVVIGIAAGLAILIQQGEQEKKGAVAQNENPSASFYGDDGFDSATTEGAATGANTELNSRSDPERSSPYGENKAPMKSGSADADPPVRQPGMDDPGTTVAVPEKPAADPPEKKPEPGPEPEMKPETKPAPKPEPKPQPQATPEQMAKVQAELIETLEWLRDRNVKEAKTHLAAAEKLAVGEDLRTRVEQIKVVTQGVEEFWKAVAGATAELEAGEELVIGDNTRIAIVEASEQRLVFRMLGQTRRVTPSNMPSGLAKMMADRWFAENNAANQVFIGAFMLVDRNATLAQARKYWEQAQAAGAPIDYLLPLLESDLIKKFRGDEAN